MAKLNRKQIQERALEVLENHPLGIRWSELLRIVEEGAGETPHNSVHGGIHALLTTRTDLINMVARGTYQLAKFVTAEDEVATTQELKIDAEEVSATSADAAPLTEQDFYASFAQWLEENEDATVASALGGATLGGKWGTPDVIGVLKPRAQDIFRFEPRSSPPKSRRFPVNPSPHSAKPLHTGFFAPELHRRS